MSVFRARWARPAFVGVAAVIVLAVSGVAPAMAATANSGVDPNAAAPAHSAWTTGSAAAPGYWTRQRMLAATPVTPPVADQKPVVAPTSTGPAGHVAGALATGIHPDSGIFNMTGRIFFTEDDGTNHSCTGSIVNSNGKDLVFTAGHCVHGQGSSHTWWTNWVFVPGYSQGNAPHGYWYENQFWSMTGWTQDGNRYYDVGIAIMATDANGNHIANVLGGQGIEWNYGYSQSVYDFGYPADPPYDGSTMYYCTGTTYPDITNLGTFPRLDCGMNGGASGGPWLTGYSDSNYWATLYTVNSWMFFNGTDANTYAWEGPYFGDDVGNLFNQVQNL